MLYRVPLAWAGFELVTLEVNGTDCIGKSNYHMIMTTTSPILSGRHILLDRELLEIFVEDYTKIICTFSSYKSFVLVVSENILFLFLFQH